LLHATVFNGGSVRLDMSPNPVAGELATLIVKRLDYNVSTDGYHNYRYGNAMLECRYWVYVVMKDFRDAGWIGGTGNETYSAVCLTWTTGGVQMPKTPVWTQGTFG
ncbi:uncharacterized protein BDZ99DRAFT_394364, partial [Mytilinidion resinicola]